MNTLRLRRLFLPLLVVGGVVFAATPRPIHAAMGGCISDPLVILSNGGIMHLYAVLPDSTINDLQSITYSLVLPKGTTVLLEVNTDGILGIAEHFQYTATNPPGIYDTTTFVQTATSGDPVTATASIGLTGASVTGETYQPLRIRLYR
jgi:hypothetical protein